MTDAGFSLFGFDLYGLGRRMPAKANEQNVERKTPEKARDDHDATHVSDREHSESFFWGMYPVY